MRLMGSFGSLCPQDTLVDNDEEEEESRQQEEEDGGGRTAREDAQQDHFLQASRNPPRPGPEPLEN